MENADQKEAGEVLMEQEFTTAVINIVQNVNNPRPDPRIDIFELY